MEAFELPKMADDEVLATVVTNSICMSCHKATIQGADHKRVPKDIASNPIIIGHEFAGTIQEVGKKWKGKFKPGQKYSIQPAIVYPGRELEAPGYSFRWIGGNATAILVPKEVLEMNCLLPYDGEGFFKASLSEPVSCVIGAFNTQYHFKAGEYVHRSGIVEGGAMAVLAGAGPMGLETIDYAVHGPRRPRLLVVTDIDQGRLDRAAQIFTVVDAAKHTVDLRYVNTSGANPLETLKALTQGKGYDDVFVFAPVPALIEQGSRLLAFNGCLNFFAGPSKQEFFAAVNFYEIHYSGHHVVGSSGGNTDDMREGLDLMAKNVMNPAVMVTHIGGLDCAAKTIIDLPSIPGAKKLIYTGVSLPLTALADFGKLGQTDPFFKELARITDQHDGLWSIEAENYLLAKAKPIRA
jgi:threonine dehydrogenase-like Zn-dependent dehydrogenase